MADIASRAGASKETLYAWFGSRDQLVSALVEANADVSARRVAEALDSDRTERLTPAQVLCGYGEGLLTLLTSAASVALNRAAVASPALATIVLRSGRHRVGPLVEQYLDRLHQAGVIDAADARAAYRTLYGLLVSDTQIRVLLGEPPPSRAEIAAQAASAVGDFLTLLAPDPLRS